MIRLRNLVGCCCGHPVWAYSDVVDWHLPTEAAAHCIVVVLGCVALGAPNNFASRERYANGVCPPADVGSSPLNIPGRPFILFYDPMNPWTYRRVGGADDNIVVELDISDTYTGSSPQWVYRSALELRMTLGADRMVWRRGPDGGLIWMEEESTSNGAVDSLAIKTRVGPGIWVGAAPPAAVEIATSGWAPGFSLPPTGGGEPDCPSLNLTRTCPLVYAGGSEIDGHWMAMGSVVYESAPPGGISVRLEVRAGFGRSNTAGLYVQVQLCAGPGCDKCLPGRPALASWYSRIHPPSISYGGPGEVYGVNGAWLAPVTTCCVNGSISIA